MFCVNCGKPIDDGKTLCNECAGAQNMPYNPNEEPVYHAAPVVEEPAFQLNNPGEMTKKPKKKGKFPVGGLVALLVVAAIAVCGFVFWENVQSFFVRSFASPEDYMAHVEKKAAEEQINSITNAYGSVLGLLGAAEAEDAELEAFRGEMRIELGEDILDMLSTSMEYSDMDMDFDWLSNIFVTMYANPGEDLSQIELGVGLDDVTVATLSMIMGLQSGDVYYGIPELSDTYFYMDMSGYMDEVDASAEEMELYQEMMLEMVGMLPSKEKLNEVLNRYMDIVLANLQDVEKDSEVVEVDGVEQKLNVITCTAEAEDILNIAIAILEDVKEDEELLECVCEVAAYYAEMSGYGENILDEDMIDEALDTAIENLEDQKDDLEVDVSVELTTYVDNSDKIVGRTVEVDADGETQEIYYITVWENNEFAFEADIAGQMEITGSGSRDGSLLEGEYVLEVQGQELLVLEVEDYDEDAAEDGYLNGTFTLSPSSELLEAALSQAGASELSSYLINPAIVFAFENSETTSSVTMRLEMAGTTVVGFTVSGEMLEATAIEEPEDYVEFLDATGVVDQTAMLEWLQSADFDAILDKMEEAGVPDLLIDYLAEALENI